MRNEKIERELESTSSGTENSLVAPLHSSVGESLLQAGSQARLGGHGAVDVGESIEGPRRGSLGDATNLSPTGGDGSLLVSKLSGCEREEEIKEGSQFEKSRDQVGSGGIKGGRKGRKAENSRRVKPRESP